MHIRNKIKVNKKHRERRREMGLQSKNNQSRVEDYQALISGNGNFSSSGKETNKREREAKRRISQHKHNQSLSLSLSLSLWVSLVFLIVVEAMKVRAKWGFGEYIY